MTTVQMPRKPGRYERSAQERLEQQAATGTVEVSRASNNPVKCSFSLRAHATGALTDGLNAGAMSAR